MHELRKAQSICIDNPSSSTNIIEEISLHSVPNKLRSSTSTESEETPPAVIGDQVVCPNQADHGEGKLLSNTIVPIPTDQLYNLIFGKNDLMQEIFEKNSASEITFHPWEKDEETGNSKRTVTYTMELPPTGLGPKSTSITEIQTLFATSKPGHCYVIEVDAFNHGIPYADHFFIRSHYCITKENSTGDSSRYFAAAKIKYKKSTWGIIKSIIERNAFNGMDAIQQELCVNLLKNASNRPDYKPNMIKKRKRRTASADLRNQKFTNVQTPETSKPEVKGSKWRGYVVFTFLIILASLNVLLLLKLKILETQMYMNNGIDLSVEEKVALKNWIDEGRSWKEIIKILEKQEDLHTKQLSEWTSLLLASSNALNTAEKSINEVRRTLFEYRDKRKNDLMNNIKENSVIKPDSQIEETYCEEL